MYVRNYKEGLDVPWQSFFGTDDRATVEAYCRSAGIEYEWTADDGLRTRKVAQAIAARARARLLQPDAGAPCFVSRI